MPLYEYQCDACGKRFEKIQKFSDAPIEVCPTCGEHVHKLVSSPAFQFKGTGWYVTDYSRKDKGGESESKSRHGKDSKDSSESRDSKDSKDSKDSGQSDKDSKASDSKSGSDSKSSESKSSGDSSGSQDSAPASSSSSSSSSSSGSKKD